MNDVPMRKHSDVMADYLPQAGRRILDVGCGEGALVRHFARNGAQAVGLDPLEQAIERALAADNPLGATFMLGGGESLPFPDNDFDVVCFFNSLHHVETELMGKALSEALRVTQGEGLIYVLEPIARGAYFDLVRPIDDETKVRQEAMEALDAFSINPAVRALEEIVYEAPVHYKGFNEWEASILSVDPGRAARLVDHRDTLEKRFVETAGRNDQGRFLFRQPTRLNLFAKMA